MAKSSSKGTSVSDAYGQFASSMAEAGQRGLDGRGTSSASRSTSSGRGPSPSSPAGGSRAASGVGAPGSANISRGEGPSPSSPGGGARAASGVGVGGSANIGTGLGPSPSSPAGGARAASGLGVAGRASVNPNTVGRGLAVSAGIAPPNMSARSAEDMSMARHNAWQGALSTIRGAEGRRTDPYRSVGYASSYGQTHRSDLTDMTLAEVIRFQEEQDGSAGKSYKHDRTYLGAYQIGRSALRDAIARTGVDPDTAKFTESMQDFLAMDLAQNRANQATKGGAVDPETYATRLAQEWAGLATANGKSYYDGRAGNKASVGYETVLGIAKDLVGSGAVTPRGADNTFELPETVDVPPSRPTTATASANAGVGVTAPQDRFASIYLGPAPSPAQGARAASGTDAIGSAFVAPSVPSSTPMSREDYLGPEVAIPRASPPAQSAQPQSAPPPPAAPQQQPEASEQRSGLVPAIIDGVLTMVPGVGVAATGFNVVAGLTGRQSLGTRIANMFGEAEFGKYPLSETDGRGKAGDPWWKDKPGSALTPTEHGERFGAIYLSPINDIDRPTPREKWGDRTRYGSVEYA